jgi:hypothetical protein
VEHPSDEVLKRFAKGKPPREESQAVVVHLLKGCPSCARKIRTFLQPDAVPIEAYDAVLERFEDGRKLKELDEAPPSKTGLPPERPSPRPPPKGKGKDR